MGNGCSIKLEAAPADPMASIVGDIGPSIDSFRRHLRASSAAPRTVSTYLKGATQFATFLAAQGMPTSAPDIRREHVEAFVVDILSRFKPATANNRYCSLLAFFKFLLEEGEITQSPMARI
jgi:site-specific recombinase XerD